MNSTEVFDENRPLLFSISYRMLGSVMEAEDVVQEAYLRWRGAAEEVRSPSAYLSTVVTRLCIDRLRSARARRERYVGSWLPEPLLEEEASEVAGTADLDDSLMNSAEQVLEPLVKQWAVLLTTYRRDGAPVGTPVNVVVEGDHAYFRTWDTAWKLRRISNNPEVHFAPSTPLGKPTGPHIRAHARILKGEESAHASRLLARKYPVSHGVVVPLVHRLRKNATMHIELEPAEGQHFS